MRRNLPAPGAKPVPDVLTALTQVRTKSGVVFDATQNIWSYRDGVNDVNLDFGQLPNAGRELLDSAKGVLSWYAESRSPDHLKNMFQRLQHFLRSTTRKDIVSVGAIDLLNYRAQLTASTSWYLGSFSGFLRKWHRLGYPGVTDDVELLLKQLRIKGNAKGVAVLTLDPHVGPFTQIEVDALQVALNNAYGTGALSLADYVLAWLHMLLGQRNKQHAALKVCDVRVMTDAEGMARYTIQMPSAKNRADNPRVVLVERPLVEQFGELLFAYAAAIRARFSSILVDSTQAPLFPASRSTRGSEGFEYHRTAADIGQILVKTLEGLSVVSERTGLPMNISAVRFRRTIGSRAAEEGHSPLVIARLLDHADTQQVGVYSANSPLIIERIDRAIAMEMAPLAQAFAGVLVRSQNSSKDASRRIIDLRIDRSGAPMGDCGKHGFCGFNAPIACYTCVSFEAWVDGPHEAVLEYLLIQREKQLQTSDKRIASINDRTICAVAAVIQACLQARALSSVTGQEGACYE